MIMKEPHLTPLTRCEWLCRNRLARDGGDCRLALPFWGSGPVHGGRLAAAQWAAIQPTAKG